MDELLTVERVSKRFQARRVLEEVSFSVRAGEILGLDWPERGGQDDAL